jgi:predicted acetyltransferase
MDSMTIRRVRGEERRQALLRLGGYAFSPSPPLPDKDESRQAFVAATEADPNLIVFDGDQPLAMVHCAPMTQHVRGRIFPMGGIWGVATMPAARRNGYAREALRRLLAEVREGGVPLTCLYAFKESFYERLGYVNFVQPRQATFSPRAVQPLMHQALEGSVEHLSIADGFDLYSEFLQHIQARTHGMALKQGDLMRQRNRYWLAVARIDGEPAGVLLYKLTGDDECLKLDGRAFLYSDVRARYLLLEWIGRHVDQADEASLILPPGELPETWYPDMAVKGDLLEPPLGRVLDVAGLGGMQVGPGEVTLRISDPFCPWNEGVYRFASEDGCLAVACLDASVEPDCALTIQALSGLVYGVRDPEVFAVRGWGDPSPAVQATLRTMFPPLLPFLYLEF